MAKKTTMKGEIGTQSDSTVATDIDTVVTGIAAVNTAIVYPRSLRTDRELRNATKKMKRMEGRLHRL